MRNSWAAAWRESSLRRLAVNHPGPALLAGSLLVAAFSTAWLLVQAPNFFSGYDFMRMHFFYKAFYREALLGGRLPLWNPFVGLGRPFMADIETATLYPPNLLVLVFGVYGGVAVSVLLHQALAVFGGVRLGRKLGASPGASWIVGAGMALGSPFTARLGVGIVEGYFSLCWMPVLLWLGATLQDRWSRRAAAVFGCSVALAILAGQPPILFVEFCGVLVFLACRQEWPSDRAARSRAIGNAGGLVLAGLLGIGLACAALLPFLELVGQGNRPLNAPGFAVANGMPFPSWLSLIVPTSAAFGPNWEYDLHCGLVPFFAAAGGALLWRDRNVRALLGMGLFGALLAAGDRAPFLRWITHVLPGAAALRIPSRYGILFAVALLGIAAVSLSRPRPRSSLATLAALALAVAGAAWLEPHVVAGGGWGIRYYGAVAGSLFAAAVGVVLWHERARWPRLAGPLGFALGACCAANWILAVGLQAQVYSQYGFRTDDAAVRAAMERGGMFSANGVPPRVSFSPTDVRENAGMVQGFGGYDSYVAPSLYRTWGYLHAAAGVPVSAGDFIRLPRAISENSRLLDGMNLAADYDHGTRTLVPRAVPDPRAYVVFAAEVVPDWRAAVAEMADRRDFHVRALLEEGSAPAFSPPAGPHSGTAAISGFAPERVTVRAVADAPAILVLAEAWYPGWGATVGGQPAEVFPVNGWMRGVLLPAGQSEVVFSFHSRLLRTGLAVSAACAILLASLALGGTGRQTASRIL